jgi:hypothetical protein
MAIARPIAKDGGVVDLVPGKLPRNHVFFRSLTLVGAVLAILPCSSAVHRQGPKACSMPSPRLLLIMTLALLPMLSLPAAAQEQPRCLSRAEQRAAIAAGEAIPLATARQMLRQRMGGELVRARLCKESGRLIYRLTVLARDGKVRQVTVDATNGTVIGGL